MDPARPQCAQRVCGACKARKKTCDKQLPSCGSCMKRGLVCQYDAWPTKSETSGDGAHVAPPLWVVYTPAAPTPPSLDRPVPSYTLFPSKCHSNLDSFAQAKLNHVLMLYGLSIDQIIDRFLGGGLHNWLPVISPHLVRAAAAEWLQALPQSPPPTDFTVLLLAMCLVVLHPTAVRNSDHATNPVDLYQTARLLLGHVQVMISPSTRLLQAAFLVCAFEYATKRLDPAYVSIGACERTARVLGIDQAPKVRHHLRDNGDAASKLRRLEEWNTWRGIVVLEKAISSEVDFKLRRPMTRYPHLEPSLLSGLVPAANLWMPLQDNSTTFKPSSVSDLLLPAISATEARDSRRFERQVQATFFLNQALQIASFPTEAEAKISQLRELDGQLLSFISTTTHGDDKSHCGALATAVRSLFLLHHTILSHSSDATTEEPGVGISGSSLAALDTAARMVSHAAEDHLETRSIESLPPCCAYNLRAAIEHMQNRHNSVDEGGSFLQDLQSCITLEKALLERWEPPSQ